MNRTVLIALDHQKLYQELVTHLESGESSVELEISQNIENQAALLYFLPKVKPQIVVISETLPGDLSFEDLQHQIRQAAAETEILVFRGDFQPIVDKLLVKPPAMNKIIAVWSPAGGVGKTTIAVNLALAAGQDYRVILVDANLCNPDVAQQLGVGYKRGHTLSAALELWSENRLSASALKKITVPYGTIQVLAGSDNVIEQTDYSPAFFRDLITALSQLADFVIVDLHSDITSPAGISVLLVADQILCPFNTMVSTLGHGKAYIDLLKDSYQIDPRKIAPVLNRAGEGGTVSAEDIEVCLKQAVAATIPYSKDHLLAACKQHPIILGKSVGAKRLAKLFCDLIRQYVKKEVNMHEADGKSASTGTEAGFARWKPTLFRKG